MSEEAQKGSATSLKVSPLWLVWTAVIFLMLLGFMFWLLFQGGVFGGAADGGKLTAGVLAVAGTVLTASITFVGLLLRLAQQERGIQIHKDAEDRLHMEAAIQAVRLVGDTLDGKPVSNTQRAGAIYALAHLGQMPLALVLLDQLWEEEKIDSTFGVLIVNDVLAGDEDYLRQHGLEGDQDSLQQHASRILLDYGTALWTSSGTIRLPQVVEDWTGSLA